MTEKRRWQVLDGTQLKLIAMACMVIDHIGAVFFPQKIWMRAVGRIAMPIFSFFIAEGYHFTHDRKKYLLRMGLFAAVSELPFDLAFFRKIKPEHQNIMLSFFLAIGALIIYDAVKGAPGIKGKALKTVLGTAAVLAAAALALVLRTDYTFYAVISVFIFHLLREKRYPAAILAGVGFLALTRTMGYYAYTGLAALPLLLYNGERGKGLKDLFYVFYPGHLLLIYIARLLVRALR